MTGGVICEGGDGDLGLACGRPAPDAGRVRLASIRFRIEMHISDLKVFEYLQTKEIQCGKQV